MANLVKITGWKGEEIDAGTDPKWYGTQTGENGHWPGFLSFEDFENWPEAYDTYHADMPNQSRYEILTWEELPESIRAIPGLKDHVDWMLED